ncbi:hypothetical protein [Plebeiibacterium sediminum]|uniref:Uncharacterized protein n=1 Tax=Plebeiibacterium sediminum TaxID=2992112 RepID=A0AAE3SHM0_9BACT|nr:hypothetical protein [Plebeiobacterium sediminum]MCW3789675.1 hypothetical protein [Plebeiobacterium sediminum]
MTLEKIIEEIEGYYVDSDTEDAEIISFFEAIGDKIYKIRNINNLDKSRLITSFFNYLKNQTPELEENWTFIHLLEDIDKPKYSIYNDILIETNKTRPTYTSVLLLNRHINSIESGNSENYIDLLREISENKGIHEDIREIAAEFYQYQLTKK